MLSNTDKDLKKPTIHENNYRVRRIQVLGTQSEVRAGNLLGRRHTVNWQWILSTKYFDISRGMKINSNYEKLRKHMNCLKYFSLKSENKLNNFFLKKPFKKPKHILLKKVIYLNNKNVKGRDV